MYCDCERDGILGATPSSPIRTLKLLAAALALRHAHPLNRDRHHGGSNASARNLTQINVAAASTCFPVIATVPVVRAVVLHACLFSFKLKAARLGGLFFPGVGLENCKNFARGRPFGGTAEFRTTP